MGTKTIPFYFKNSEQKFKLAAISFYRRLNISELDALNKKCDFWKKFTSGPVSYKKGSFLATSMLTLSQDRNYPLF